MQWKAPNRREHSRHPTSKGNSCHINVMKWYYRRGEAEAINFAFLAENTYPHKPSNAPLPKEKFYFDKILSFAFQPKSLHEHYLSK